MDFRDNRPMKIISFIVLFFFSWSFAGGYQVAYAVKDSEQSTVDSDQKEQKKQRPEEKFQKTIEDIDRIVEEVEKARSSEEQKLGRKKLKAKRLEIEELDKEIKKQFAETEQKLKDAKLPDKILKRHYDFVKKYEDNLEELKANLEAVEKAKTEVEEDREVEKIRKFLEKIKPPKKHIPLDPNKLPHRTPEPTKKKPRTKPEEFGIGQRGKNIAHSAKSRGQRAKSKEEPILVASNGHLTGILTPDPFDEFRAGSDYLDFPLPFETPNSEPTKSLRGLQSVAISPILLALADPPTSADLADVMLQIKATPKAANHSK